ncbi:hypothetical protein KIN20_030425 [Parelaphostrongylus tenuis]|uniref:Uncharacterized protein n=1 Tax=Parelaphostrongylus tenuis TaxID=148309 RepID=A0AAD5R3R1_PARTN|nr:hypothetical protein KIN20_030425 [Parelaphostrongylus tenuis]
MAAPQSLYRSVLLYDCEFGTRCTDPLRKHQPYRAEQYNAAREQLQSRIADKIRRQMSTLYRSSIVYDFLPLFWKILDLLQSTFPGFVKSKSI